MKSPLESQLTENPLYLKMKERSDADKPPSRSNALGAVAHARGPVTESRTELINHIRDQDKDLQLGYFGAIRYKPITVCGLDLKLEPLHPSIGTIVHGIDLNRDLENPDVVTFLRELWLERRVIGFRGQQHMTRNDMVRFAQRFGEVGEQFGEREHRPNSPHDINQQIKVPDIPNMLVLPADEVVPNAASGWHCDATWQPKPPMGSILMCREAPPIGGDTCFCDCYAMWEGLPLRVKERVEFLRAVHVGSVGHQMDGKTPSAVHPVARTHPETGRTTLYVQQGFVKKFADEHEIPTEEQRELLHAMKMQEGRPEYTCRFRWEEGSIAMWDNRAVLHTASGDFWPHRRLMERLTILDFDQDRRAPYYAPDTQQSVESIAIS